MNPWKQLRLLAIPVVLALVVSAMTVSPAYADDETPPPTDASPAEAPPAEDGSGESPPAEAAADEAPQAEETPAAEETSEPATAQEPDASEEASVAEILAEVPEGTDVLVLDGNGEVLPLATEAAADVVAGGDPIWCPSGVGVPNPGVGGCSPSFTNFNGLGGLWVWLFVNDPATAGTIWIEKGYDSFAVTEGDVSFNGDDFANMVNYSLTLKGGWNGCTPTCVGTVDTTDNSLFSGDSLSIFNWTGAITLSGITIQNATTNGSSSAALYLETVKDIKLERVHVDNNDGALGGAILDNNDSPGTGVISIKTSTFTNNDTYGLFATSDRTITLTDVTASFNDTSYGAYLSNTSAVTPQNIVLAGLNTFNQNGDAVDPAGDNGLFAYSDGAITVKHVIANGNLGDGVRLDNSTAPTAKAVTISGSGQFQDNVANGLVVDASGVVTLNNLNAYSNGIDGVNVINYVLLDPASPAVNINGVNQFNSNGDDGLFIDSDGAIKVSSTVANNNGWGVYLYNSTVTSGTPGVTIVGFLTAIQNTNQGLNILTLGTVTAANLTTNNNGEQGTLIFNYFLTSPPKAVKITGTNFFNDNSEEGLQINSKGAVTISNITAIFNGYESDLSGVYIDNAVDLAIQQNVTISGTNVFNHNSLNGLEIFSYGSVTLANVTANDNGDGAVDPLSFGSGAVIDNTGAVTYAKSVTLSGTNNFNQNEDNGLYILATGAVTLNNLNAYSNTQGGVWVENNIFGTATPVSVNGVNNFISNGDDGLVVYSDGTIKVSKVTSSNNADFGVYLYNPASPSAQPVTIVGFLTAMNNVDDGLYINSHGAVTAANLNSSNNAGEGVYIDNDAAPTPKAVTITGNNLFVDNANDGLQIYSYGAVSLSNLTALSNGNADLEAGVYIDNFNLAVPGNQPSVTLNGVNVFSDNYYIGLEVYSYGVVTVNNATANNNGEGASDGSGDGVLIDNDGGTLAKPVAFKGTNSFNFNDEDGLDVTSIGAITLSKITAYDNDNNGLELDNLNGSFQSNVTISGYGLFEWNLGDGLNVISNGAITTSNLTANYNLGDGVDLYTIGLTAPKAVTLNGNNTFTFNGDAVTESGLQVDADGTIKVNNLTASNNFHSGADLDNYTNWNAGSFATFGSVTLTGFGNFSNNGTGHGLFVGSHGAVTLSRVNASFNGDDIANGGIWIQADGNVSLTCSSAFANFGDGLHVHNAVDGDGANTLTLKGFSAANNNDNEDFQLISSGPVRLPCP